MSESAQAKPVGLTVDFLTSGLWTYWRLSGLVYSENLRLLPGGRILGYSHRNESSWTLQDGQLCFLDAAGAVTTRFDEEIVDGDRERLTLRGPVAGGRIVHCLTRRTNDAPAERTDTTRFALAKMIETLGWSVGKHSYGVPHVFEAHMARLRIGSFCSIARGVSIALGDHKISNVSTYPFQRLARHWPEAAAAGTDHVTKGDVIIGDDVWIGAHAFIGSGVSIGSGAVIGAHSVVVKDVPAYAVIVGNPARIVRFRFPADVVEALLAIAWWNWDDDAIRSHMPLILSEDVQSFIRAAQRLSGSKASSETRADAPQGAPAAMSAGQATEIGKQGVHRQGSARIICLRGASDLEMMGDHLRSHGTLVQEFPFPFQGWGIVPTARAAVVPLQSPAEDLEALSAKLPGLPPGRFESALVALSAEVYILSFSQEASASLYRSRSTGIVLPMALDGFGRANLTTVSYEELAAKGRQTAATEAQWAFLRSDLEHLGGLEMERFKNDLRMLFRRLDGKQVIVLMLNSTIGSSTALLNRFADINQTVLQAVHERNRFARRPIELIALNDVLESAADLTEDGGGAHFGRHVYHKLADRVVALLEADASAA